MGKPSFRDLLIEGQPSNPTKEKVDLLSKGLVKVSFEVESRLLPSIIIEDGYMQDLCIPWKEALVLVKLLRKTFSYPVMKEIL